MKKHNNKEIFSKRFYGDSTFALFILLFAAIFIGVNFQLQISKQQKVLLKKYLYPYSSAVLLSISSLLTYPDDESKIPFKERLKDIYSQKVQSFLENYEHPVIPGRREQDDSIFIKNQCLYQNLTT